MFKLNFNEKTVDVILPLNVKDDKMYIDEVIKKQYGKIITYFVDTITKIPDVAFPYLYHNLNTLIVKKEKSPHKGIKANRSGAYYGIKNKLIVYELTSIYHELFHMASNYYWEEKGQLFTGFEQSTTFDRVGVGINEGYTEILVKRYFNIDGTPYVDEMKLASIIETVVGKEKMTQLYFKADLKGLMDEIKIYADGYNIRKFIDLVDCIYNNKNYEGCTLIETYGLAYGFALRIVANKLFMDYANSIITYDLLIDRLKYYSKICGGDLKTCWLTDEVKNEIIKAEYEKFQESRMRR